MEAGFLASIMAVLLSSVLSLTLGIVIGRTTKQTYEPHGVLNVDCSDPSNGAYLYLNLTTSIPEVADQKRVLFDVHVIK